LRRAESSLRARSAPADGHPINNLPGRYPAEDWVVHYWDVQPDGEVRSRQAVIQLPEGYATVCRRIQIGERGCLHQVRRWGIECYTRCLEDMGFDPYAYLSNDAARFPGGADQEAISVLLNAAHFELPAHFVLGSEEHPVLLFDPSGELKGSGTRWYSYLGALAHILSDGDVSHRFGLLRQADGALYCRAVDYLLDAIRKRTQ